jgi:hypothetical protein
LRNCLYQIRVIYKTFSLTNAPQRRKGDGSMLGRIFGLFLRFWWAVLLAALLLVCLVVFWPQITWPTAVQPPTTVEVARANLLAAKKDAGDKFRIAAITKHSAAALAAAGKAAGFDEESIQLSSLANDSSAAISSLLAAIQSEAAANNAADELKTLEACRLKKGPDQETCLKPFVEASKPKIVRDWEAKQAQTATATKTAEDEVKKRLEAAEKAVKDAEDSKKAAEKALEEEKKKKLRPATTQNRAASPTPTKALAGGACVKVPPGFSPTFPWECKD